MVTPRTHGTIDIDGLAVFYETEGDGEPIVLLHGGLADNSTWAAQFSGLSPHRRVVAPERQAQGHHGDGKQGRRGSGDDERHARGRAAEAVALDGWGQH